LQLAARTLDNLILRQLRLLSLFENPEWPFSAEMDMSNAIFHDFIAIGYYGNN
jgi:hypothetical protein